MCNIQSRVRDNNRGTSVLIAVIMMSIILSIGFGVSSLVVQEAGVVEKVGRSVNSFYAADSGVEAQLYQIYKADAEVALPGFIDIAVGEAVYNASATCGSKLSPADCPLLFDQDIIECTNNFCLKSKGSYRGNKRAIQIVF